ncbi:hypothetical protein ACFLTH_08085 [Bacteroidota bacterium]
MKFTRSGGTLSQAKNKLIKAGHKQPDVEEAASKVKQRKKQEVGAIVLGVIVLIAIIILILKSFYVEETQTPESSHDRLLDAIGKGDISACDQFNPVKRDVCRRSILGEVGGDNPPPVPPEQEYIQQAADLQDPAMCDSIVSEVQKQKCLVVTGGYEEDTVENTVNQVESNVAYEITKEAVETGDSSLCEQIANPVDRQLCELSS